MSPLIYRSAPAFIAFLISELPEPPHIAMRDIGFPIGAEAFSIFRENLSLTKATASSEETIKWLKDNNIRIYTAQLQDSEWYYDTDMTGGTAIVMGTEATGLTDVWRKAADAHIKIPMLGRLDSLNVSVSAAILMYEAVRQRNM